jgi:hypothetical protein
VALYILEVTIHGQLVRMEPLPAAEAYTKTIELRREGITQIVALDLATGRRITNVRRLLRDLER